MRRETCAGCRAALSADNIVLDLGPSPLADEFPTKPDAPTTAWPLQLAMCHECNLAQLMEVVGDDLLWGGDYAFYARSAAPVVAYMREYAAWLLRSYGMLIGPKTRDGMLVEIGSNDGTLLEPLIAGGAHVLGVDPALGPVNAARARGIYTMHAPFSREVAEKICCTHGAAQIIVANNVAAHVADPIDFFAGVAQLLASNGSALIEAQYLPDLVLGNDFTLLYHEHRCYYSVTSLRRLAEDAG